MKKKLVLIPIIACIGYITLMSNSAGYNSANLTSTGCGGTGCHGTSATTAVIVNGFLDSAGVTKFSYRPGVTYNLHVGGLYATTTLRNFGFQVTMTNSAGTTQAGTFGTLPSQTVMNTHAGINVVGHNSRIAGSVLGTNTAYLVTIPWTAPATGIGPIKISVALNCVDSNGSATTSDKWNTLSVTVPQAATSGVNEVAASAIAVSTYPNPVVGSYLNVAINSAAEGVYSVRLYDMKGINISSEMVTLNGGAGHSVLSMQQCAAGVYQLVVEKDGNYKVTAVVKQ